MSKLLIDDKPIAVLPKLAEAIGLNEAIILQQVHYWVRENTEHGRNYHDGRYWTYNSYTKWQETTFRWWTKRTIQRIFLSLEKLELVLVGNFNRLGIDRTKWYTVNYDELDKLTESLPERTKNVDHDDNLSPLQNVTLRFPLLGHVVDDEALHVLTWLKVHAGIIEAVIVKKAPPDDGDDDPGGGGGSVVVPLFPEAA